MTGIRVAIVDDQQIARWGLERIFANHARCHLIASVPSVAELEALDVTPDIVFAELYLGGTIAAFDTLTHLSARFRVVAMSSRPLRPDAIPALRAGAHGLLSKRAAVDDFVASIETVSCGGLFVPQQLADDIFALLGAKPGALEPRQLTPREREALGNVACGLTHSQAAGRMGVSVSTFNTYICRVREKLGVGNKAELTRRAIELGLAS